MLMESQHRSQSKSMAVRMRQVATFMRTGQPGQPGLGKPSGLLAQRSGRTRKSIRRIGIFQYESQHVQFPSYASISFRMKGKRRGLVHLHCFKCFPRVPTEVNAFSPSFACFCLNCGMAINRIGGKVLKIYWINTNPISSIVMYLFNRFLKLDKSNEIVNENEHV